MGFLKDFKRDLSQAVSGLAEENVAENEGTEVAVEEVAIEELAAVEDIAEGTLDYNVEEVVENISDDEMVNTIDEEEFNLSFDEIGEMPEEEIEVNTLEDSNIENSDADIPSDEMAEITKGMTIEGTIESNGSVKVYGKIKGDITCKGKLMVAGHIVGISNAGEIFAKNAKIEGDIHSKGTIKIGTGSVILGNIYAETAVIGGAIKGDIDVQGPVIVDSTAVIQGNIKSRSVQINNGAVVEGFCSQCYSEVDCKSLFEDTFSIDN